MHAFDNPKLALFTAKKNSRWGYARKQSSIQWGPVLALWIFAATHCAGASFSVATYNLEANNGGETAPSKTAESRAKTRESILAINPDVIALQEIEGTNVLLALRADLQLHGAEFPHWELVAGADTNRHVAVLSKFPFITRNPHTNLSYLLHGRRYPNSRGFADLEIRVTPTYAFHLLVAHLKSRRASAVGDEQEMREQEALLLREIIDRHLAAGHPLLVAGDLNDTKSSRTLRTLLGRGRTGLADLRPAERNGDNQPNPVPQFDPRNITWTHYYGKEDEYSRIDYLLASRDLARLCDREGTYVLALPNWGVASDHRPIVARFNLRVGTK